MKAKEDRSIIKAGTGFGQGLVNNQTPAVMSSSNEIPDFFN